MKNLNMEILKLIYLKSRLSDKIEDYQLEFPKNIYEGMIVFQSSPFFSRDKGNKNKLSKI